VALGALLCVLGGVTTASPALTGRCPQWQLTRSRHRSAAKSPRIPRPRPSRGQ